MFAISNNDFVVYVRYSKNPSKSINDLNYVVYLSVYNIDYHFKVPGFFNSTVKQIDIQLRIHILNYKNLHRFFFNYWVVVLCSSY
jgi:hypothetical protein